ncbi:uncharacterized protein OCT59_026680 [Rhizophagus irregularis]|uniref:uncharacterized protein n=1 Tax=Rhizophagus irregularis TaxID=588596 RepID=UPI003331C9D8|nr:hypothetical protein OCT59_026680 [Rhizophagus irregularis]
MNQIKLYGKPIRVNKATSDKKNLDVDASLFIRNLDPGTIRSALLVLSYRLLRLHEIPILVMDGKGERHGSAAERLLAAQAKKIKNLCLQMSIFIRYVVYQENRFGWELRFGGSLEFFSASVVFFCRT